ncbi:MULTISPECIES: hypothetical protein [Actinosynnema]|uniref:hypothetical protein n=1 Tax=Actinosynnema TaxID=40566 RepID=UPI0020A2D0B3|nr:hypothetical protein [Actinosynnema pretiosum]
MRPGGTPFMTLMMSAFRQPTQVPIAYGVETGYGVVLTWGKQDKPQGQAYYPNRDAVTAMYDGMIIPVEGVPGDQRVFDLVDSRHLGLLYGRELAGSLMCSVTTPQDTRLRRDASAALSCALPSLHLTADEARQAMKENTGRVFPLVEPTGLLRACVLEVPSGAVLLSYTEVPGALFAFNDLEQMVERHHGYLQVTNEGETADLRDWMDERLLPLLDPERPLPPLRAAVREAAYSMGEDLDEVLSSAGRELPIARERLRQQQEAVDSADHEDARGIAQLGVFVAQHRVRVFEAAQPRRPRD